MWFEASGRLKYGPGITAAVWLNFEIIEYYYSLIPKYYYAQPQMYPTHVTVVRLGREQPHNMELWGKYQGEKVSFRYEGVIRQNGPYFNLPVFSEKISEIRQELGLPQYRTGFDCYHITVGNLKHQNPLYQRRNANLKHGK